MDLKETALAVTDRLACVKAILKVTGIAAGNAEYFPKEGQDISVIIDMAVGELSGCCSVLEAALDGHGHSGGGPHP